LVARFRRGEESALAEVYEMHAERLRRWVDCRLLRPSSSSAVYALAPFLDSDDVVQEVFARAFRSNAREAFSDGQSYQGYLRRVARNLVVDLVRRARSEKQSLEKYGADQHDRGQFATPDDAYIAEDLRTKVGAYLVNTSSDLLTLLHLRFCCGLPEQRAATLLEISRRQLRQIEADLLRGIRLRVDSTKLRPPFRPSRSR
jgi:RNA polymerase sigma factor (sigma-70 family)